MNPIFLNIFGFNIYYYGLIIALAFYIAIVLGKYIGKQYNFPPDLLDSYAFTVIISSIIGARLYYVAFFLDYYLANPMDILALRNGGLAIHGGIIGGIIGTLIFAKLKKINTLNLGDTVAAPLMLGQALGRIGNLMNGEVHGVPTFTPFNIIFSMKPKFYEWYSYYNSLPLVEQIKYKNLVPWGVTFPTSSPAGSEFPNLDLHPAMMYESILNLIAFLILFFIIRKQKNKYPGYVWFCYLIFYSVNRIFTSFFRAEDLMAFGMRAPHLISIITIIASIIGMFLSKKYYNKTIKN